jgi:deoxyribodipyrimidine photolyase
MGQSRGTASGEVVEKITEDTHAVGRTSRDLRVHDNPMLRTAVSTADTVIPLFVLDTGIAATGYPQPNRASFLADCLQELHQQLRERGGRLVLRRGDVVEQVARLAEEFDVGEVHAAGDVSAYARRREHALSARLGESRRVLRVHDARSPWWNPVRSCPRAAVITSEFSPRISAAARPRRDDIRWTHRPGCACPSPTELTHLAGTRPRGDRWRHAPDELAAWEAGPAGYPIVDAAMRQLRTEGWMHNRARLIVSSFLTKTLYLDWRDGARHFLRHLVDGDIANNQLNWQWVAGTGTGSRLPTAS